jgi:tryptophanyl-tRNA synthetase
VVPVGVDQAPHLEFAREIVRSFNHRVGRPVLVEPVMKATEVPKVLGTDGQQKMSKSLNNHIELAATPEETTARVMTMVTDPARVRRTDPGNPDVCNVFTLEKIFTPADQVAMINVECRRAGIGCVECKQIFAASLNEHLAPFRPPGGAGADPARSASPARRRRAARRIAVETMGEVRQAIGLPSVPFRGQLLSGPHASDFGQRLFLAGARPPLLRRYSPTGAIG